MPKPLRFILLSVLVVFVLWTVQIIFWPSPSIAQSVPPSPAENLDADFWVADTQDFIQELSTHQVTLEEWIKSLNQSNQEFLCIGETHTDPFRQFLADRIFADLKVDVLMLEGDRTEVEERLVNLESSVSSVNLVGVDIAGVLRAVQSHNPSVQIVGVDESNQQTAWKNLEQVQSDRRRLSRDGFIAQNIRDEWQPGLKHVALFGAKHCSTHNLGLGNARPFFRHLMDRVIPRDRMTSIQVASFSQNHPLAQILKSVGQDQEIVVIPDTHAIAPEVFNLRWEFTTLFENYDAIVLFP